MDFLLKNWAYSGNSMKSNEKSHLFLMKLTANSFLQILSLTYVESAF